MRWPSAGAQYAQQQAMRSPSPHLFQQAQPGPSKQVMMLQPPQQYMNAQQQRMAPTPGGSRMPLSPSPGAYSAQQQHMMAQSRFQGQAPPGTPGPGMLLYEGGVGPPEGDLRATQQQAFGSSPNDPMHHRMGTNQQLKTMLRQGELLCFFSLSWFCAS